MNEMPDSIRVRKCTVHIYERVISLVGSGTIRLSITLYYILYQVGHVSK